MQLAGTWGAFVLGCMLALALTACSKSPEELFATAQERSRANDVDAAIIYLKNALQQRPDYLAARRLLGEQYLRVGEPGAALKELERARQLGAPETEMLPLILRAMLDEGRSTEVLDQLGKMPEKALTAELWSLRGDALLVSTDTDGAEKSYVSAIRMKPELADAHMGQARIAWLKGDAPGAEREFERALKLDPSSVRTWLSRGDFALSRGDVKGALLAYQAAQKRGLGADKIRSEIGLSRSYLVAGNFPEAKKHLASLKKLAPGLPLTHYLFALDAYMRRDFGAAQQLILEGVARAPSDLRIALLQGNIYVAQNKLNEAVTAVERVVSLSPDDLGARKLLARIYARQERADKIVATLSAAESEGDGARDAELLSMLGSAYMRIGERGKGMVMLERAAIVAPRSPEILTQLAMGELTTGESEVAIGRLRSAAGLSDVETGADVLLVMVLLRDKKFDQALKETQKLISAHPNDPRWYDLAATAWIGLGNDAKAREQLARAFTVDPKYAAARLTLALLAEKDGDLNEAYKQYQLAFEHDARDYRGLAGAVRLDVGSGRAARAVAQLQKVIAEHPDAIEPRTLLFDVYASGADFAAALQVAQASLAVGPQNSSVRLQKGLALLNLQRFGEAIDVLEMLATDDPKNVEARFVLARAYLGSRDVAAALQAVDAALRLSNRAHSPSLMLAVTLAAQQGHFDDARRLLAELRALRDTSANLDLVDGEIRLAAGEYAEAVKSLRAALAIRPSTDVMHKLAQALVRGGDAATARSELTAWLRRIPNDTGSRLMLADLLMRNGQRAESKLAYEEVLRISPENPLALNNMAWLLLADGDRRAIDYAETALRLLPDSANVMDTAAWVRFKTGRRDGVLELIQSALKRNPTPEIRYHLAEVLASSGDRAAARRELDLILAPGAPSFPSRDAAIALRKRN